MFGITVTMSELWQPIEILQSYKV